MHSGEQVRRFLHSYFCRGNGGMGTCQNYQFQGKTRRSIAKPRPVLRGVSAKYRVPNNTI
jgi:hypothetical protein